MVRTAQFILVSPEQAIVWMDSNTRNRKFRKWYAIALAEAIKRGEWIVTHQGIAFSESGLLLDGQHRLFAIILAGISVEMLIVTGIEDSAFMVLDRGLGRTYTDVTGLPKKTSELAAIAARYLYFCGSNSGKPSSQQVLNIADAAISEIQQKIESRCSANVKILTCAPMRLAVAYMLMRGYSEDFVLGQYSALAKRDYAQLTVASQAFLRRVDGGAVNAHNDLDLIVRAINCFDPTRANITKMYATDEQKGETKAAILETLKKIVKSA